MKIRFISALLILNILTSFSYSYDTLAVDSQKLSFEASRQLLIASINNKLKANGVNLSKISPSKQGFPGILVSLLTNYSQIEDKVRGKIARLSSEHQSDIIKILKALKCLLNTSGLKRNIEFLKQIEGLLKKKELRLSYRGSQDTDEYNLLVNTDAHGDLFHLMLPFIKQGLVEITGNCIFYDTGYYDKDKNKYGKIVDSKKHWDEIFEQDFYNEGELIVLPEIKLKKDLSPEQLKNIVQNLGDYIDRGMWSDECFYLIAYLLDILPNGSLNVILGNHELMVLFNRLYQSGHLTQNIKLKLKELIRERRLKAVDVKNNVMYSHSFISVSFLVKLFGEIYSSYPYTAVFTKGKADAKKVLNAIAFFLMQDRSELENLYERKCEVDFSDLEKDAINRFENFFIKKEKIED